MADAVLAIKIVTDYTQGQKGLAAADTGVGKLQSRLNKMAAPAAVAVGAITLFGKAAVDAASRTEQAMGAVESVFGKNAGTVKRWADGAAESVGLAKSEYMELASVIGAQLKNMGVPLDQVAGKTDKLVRLGADLAATYGGTTKEAVEALGSALRGETDPIERYGVSIKQADIAARMAADGTDKLTGKQGKQAKTAATLALITQQSADAHGQFAEESDTAAVSAQKTAAKYENMKSALGEALLPVMESSTTALGGLAEKMEKHQTATQAVILSTAALAAAVLAVNAALRVYTAATVVATAVTSLMGKAALGTRIQLLALAAAERVTAAATWLLNAAMSANPIMLAVLAIMALVVALTIAYQRSATFRAIVDGLWKSIKSGAMAAGRIVKSIWTSTWNAISKAAQAVGNAARSAFRAVQTAINAVINAGQKLIAKLRSIKVPGVIKSAFDTIRNAISNVISKVGDLISKLRNISVPGAIKTALNAIKTAADNVVDAIKNIVDWIRDIPTPSINWPSPPKWLDKVIPGSLSAGLPGTPGPAPLGRYVSPTGRSGRLTGRAITPVLAPGPTIVIQGALDPEGVARQVQRLMGGHIRRMGGAVA